MQDRQLGEIDAKGCTNTVKTFRENIYMHFGAEDIVVLNPDFDRHYVSTIEH